MEKELIYGKPTCNMGLALHDIRCQQGGLQNRLIEYSN